MKLLTIYRTHVRSAVAALLVVLAVLLGGCDAANRAFSASTPTPTYDPFASHGCAICDPQQKRIQATMTTSEAP